jgi:hypothetical protein
MFNTFWCKLLAGLGIHPPTIKFPSQVHTWLDGLDYCWADILGRIISFMFYIVLERLHGNNCNKDFQMWLRPSTNNQGQNCACLATRPTHVPAFSTASGIWLYLQPWLLLREAALASARSSACTLWPLLRDWLKVNVKFTWNACVHTWADSPFEVQPMENRLLVTFMLVAVAELVYNWTQRISSNLHQFSLLLGSLVEITT